MFSFFSKKKPWASPGAMETWLKQLPRGDVMQAQQAIVELLDDYLKSDDYLQLDSLPALWILSENIESLLQQLLQHYLNNHRSSSSIEKVVWEGLFEVSQRLSQAYEPLLEFEPPRLLKLLKADGLARSLAYYIHYKGLHAKIRLFRFERWMPAQWVLLHKSFVLAEQANIHTLPIVLFCPEDPQEKPRKTRVELEYIHLLLLQLLNVGSFDPAHIEQAHLWLMLDASDIWVERTVNAEGFVVDLSSTEGLVRASKVTADLLSTTKSSLRFINTYAITRLLEQQIEVTRESLNEMKDHSPLHFTLTLFEKWYGLWNHNTFVWSRKGDREKVDSSIWVVDNWNAMCQTALPLPGTESLAPEPIPVYTVGDQCRILDRSRSGYGFIGLMNETRPFKLGMLILVYDESTDEWCLCGLRRLKKLNLDQVEMGVEILGRDVRSMRPSRKKRKQTQRFASYDGYEVDMDGADSQPGMQDESVNTLYIKPQEDTKAGNQPSLIIAKRDYQPNQTYTLALDMGAFTLALAAPIDEGPGWIWCGFSATQEPLP